MKNKMADLRVVKANSTELLHGSSMKHGLKKKPGSKLNVKLIKSIMQKKNTASNLKNAQLANSNNKKISTNISSTSFENDAKSQLESSHFRYLNQQLYTVRSSEAWKLFQEDPQSFFTYHKGFENQVSKWPINPLDLIIENLQKRPKTLVIADFGCGAARLAQSLPNKIHSFDLVAVNEMVTACDMAHVPLQSESVDVSVFCLSLMGTNVNDFLLEANRVLKMGGELHIAEVESRCPNTEGFLKALENFGFCKENHVKKGYFFLATFVKRKKIPKKTVLPKIHLKPCLYKKR